MDGLDRSFSWAIRLFTEAIYEEAGGGYCNALTPYFYWILEHSASDSWQSAWEIEMHEIVENKKM
jgi:hypothetical protein